MTTIYMKIYSYDVASQSLEVGFASTETSSQNPDDYDRYSFNVDHYNDVTSKEDLIRRLLQSGSSMCSHIVQQENMKQDTTKQAWFSDLAETTHEATADSLVDEPEVTYSNEVSV